MALPRACVALVLSGAVPYGPVKFDPGEHLVGADTSWSQVWVGGRIGSPVGDLLTDALNTHASTHPAVSVVQVPGLPGPSWLGGPGR